MKKILFISLLLCGALFSLRSETVQQLERRLKMSSPGLPEFRVFNDIFGVTRSVRTLPGPKNAGTFKLQLLAPFTRISMLDISGVEKADLTGLVNFKELRFLRLGAVQISGLEKSSLPQLVRLDISNTRIKDISWLKNFPGVRILHLPETVTDISPLKGRSFRALSLPGIANSDDVCRTLNITVAIRTAHAHRRPGRDRLPPVVIKRDQTGKVTGITFLRFTPPRPSKSGFAGELFPEELAAPGVPPKFEEYPGLSAATRREPLKAASFLKDRASLQTLDLRALNGVEFAGEEFPELRELYLSGAVVNLESLKAPKLKKLHLEGVEGYLPGEKLSRRPPRFMRPDERREGARSVSLGKGLILDSLKIVPRRKEFDFDSLKNIRTNSLEFRYYGKDLKFLSGQKMTKLALFAPNITGSGTAVLGTLPLKNLKITLGPEADCSFLLKLKLRRLFLSGGKNFSIALIRKMRLESLRLQQVFGKKNDLHTLRGPALKELVLDRVKIIRPEFLGRLTDLRALALENCIFAPSGLSLREPDLDYVCGDRLSKEILKLKKLKSLRIGRIGVFTAGSRIVNYDFPWERFKALPLENFSLCAERGDFAKEYKHLKRLKIDDISRHGISTDQVRTGTLLETLVLTNARPRPDRAVPEKNSAFRRPMVPAPRREEGVAKKVYIDAPGGFDGGFMR